MIPCCCILFQRSSRRWATDMLCSTRASRVWSEISALNKIIVDRLRFSTSVSQTRLSITRQVLLSSWINNRSRFWVDLIFTYASWKRNCLFTPLKLQQIPSSVMVGLKMSLQSVGTPCHLQKYNISVHGWVTWNKKEKRRKRKGGKEKECEKTEIENNLNLSVLILLRAIEQNSRGCLN